MYGPDSTMDVLETLLAALFWILLWCGGVGGLLFLVYYSLTLPLRRAERARLFLDLLETALRQGQSVEETIIAISASRERAVGVRFHLVAAYLERGCRLGEALSRVPRLLPPPVNAMLRAGERIGDLKKVLPACRLLLADAQSLVANAKNFVAGIPFVIAPLTIFVMATFLIYILPKYKEIAEGMFEGTMLPAFTRLVFGLEPYLLWVVAAGALGLWVPLIFYLGGPRLSQWLQRTIFPFIDGISLCVPWKRKRVQRDFSAMLAVLLDSGMPEAESLTLAAQCTANTAFQRRARRASASLAQGHRLTEAVAVLDGSGEFEWRLTNATHAHGGFLRALTGWHDALTAKAFQLEQVAAQLFTSALVLFNGLLVGSFVLAMFLMLIAFLQYALLW